MTEQVQITIDELFTMLGAKEAEVLKLRAQIAALQVAYTDLKNQTEAPVDALPATLARP